MSVSTLIHIRHFSRSLPVCVENKAFTRRPDAHRPQIQPPALAATGYIALARVVRVNRKKIGWSFSRSQKWDLLQMHIMCIECRRQRGNARSSLGLWPEPQRWVQEAGLPIFTIVSRATRLSPRRREQQVAAGCMDPSLV